MLRRCFHGLKLASCRRKAAFEKRGGQLGALTRRPRPCSQSPLSVLNPTYSKPSPPGRKRAAALRNRLARTHLGRVQPGDVAKRHGGAEIDAARGIETGHHAGHVGAYGVEARHGLVIGS